MHGGKVENICRAENAKVTRLNRHSRRIGSGRRADGIAKLFWRPVVAVELPEDLSAGIEHDRAEIVRDGAVLAPENQATANSQRFVSSPR
jgi:hypothetical protein